MSECSKKFMHKIVWTLLTNLPRFMILRKEVMNLVNRSGKYSKKFEAFTGKFTSLRSFDYFTHDIP